MFRRLKLSTAADHRVTFLGVPMSCAERANTINHTAAYSCMSLWAALVGNSFLQGYLLHYGLTEANISDYSSVLNFASMLGYFLFIGYSGYGKRDQLIYACSMIGFVFTPITLVLGGLLDLTGAAFFTVLCIGGMMTTLSQSLHVVGESVMMRRAMPADSIGQVLSAAAVIGSLIGLGVSAASGRLLEQMPFPYGYYLLFGAAAFCCLPAGLLHLRLKLRPLTEEERVRHPKENYFKKICQSLKLFFRHKQTRRILLPSMLRGVKYPCVATATLIITHNVGFSDALIGGIATVSLAATLVANFLFTLLIRKVGVSAILLGSAVIGCVGMLVVGVTDDPVVALTAYFFMTIGSAGYDQACPAAVIMHMPEHLLTACTSVRLTSYSLVVTCLLPVAGRLIGQDQILPLVLCCAVAWVVSGVLHSLLFKKKTD